MASHVHTFNPGASVTCVAAEDITGGQVVSITGDREVAPAEAADTAVFGVAATDTTEGGHVLVLRGGVQALEAAGAIAAGAAVATAEGGKVAAGTTNPIGLAITSATKAGDRVQVALN